MGYLEVAVGVVGFIKLVLFIYNQVIFKYLYFDIFNFYIDWSIIVIDVLIEQWVWNSLIWIGGLSLFGFSGINCYIIVEQVSIFFDIVDEKLAQQFVFDLFMIFVKFKEVLQVYFVVYVDVFILFMVQDCDWSDVCFIVLIGCIYFCYCVIIVAGFVQ